MKGKKGLIMGVANERSIAWGISQKLAEAGAELAFTYLGDALKKRVIPLAEKLNSNITLSCDVEKKDEIIKFLSEVKGKLIEDAKKHNFLYGKQDRLSGNGHIVQERPGRSVSSLINPVPRDEGANEGTSKHTIHRFYCCNN